MTALTVLTVFLFVCPPFLLLCRGSILLFWEYLCYDGLCVLTPKSKGWRLVVGCVQWGISGSLSSILLLACSVESLCSAPFSVRISWEIPKLDSLFTCAFRCFVGRVMSILLDW